MRWSTTWCISGGAEGADVAPPRRGPHHGRRVAPGRRGGPCIVLDDFSRAKLGEFPAEWKPRKDEGREVYRVREEGNQRFLRAEAKGTGIQAARETPNWDLETYPILTWSWRPREFPKGADERKSGTNDSPLAVYVAVPYSRSAGRRR